MARRPAADWSELLRLGELMRDEPDKRCHIYRLYFNEENPLDIALRRWIWSLPSRNRCHTHQKHLGEAAHRLGQNEEPLCETVGPTGPASGLTLTLAAPEPAKPIGTTDQIQSMINRAFAPKTSASWLLCMSTNWSVQVCGFHAF